jgi:hypothetical protein
MTEVVFWPPDGGSTLWRTSCGGLKTTKCSCGLMVGAKHGGCQSNLAA